MSPIGGAYGGMYMTDTARRLMARHLRRDHGWGIRRIGKELSLTDKQVRAALGEGS